MVATSPTAPTATATSRRAVAGPWRVSLALLLALVLACLGMHVLLQGLQWWGSLVLICALMVAATAGARRLTRNRVVPSIVGAAVLLGTLTAIFATGTGVLLVFPTVDTWGRFGDLVGAANYSILTQSVPAVADEGIMFLLVAGVGIIALLADAVTIALRAPALAGIPLLGILAVPSLTVFDVSDWFVFVLTALAYLWLLRVDRPRDQRRLTVGLGATALIIALVLPSMLPSMAGSASGGGGVLTTGVNPVLSLGRDLRKTDDRTVYTYSTSSGKSHYLRLVTLENFTGADWAPDVVRVDTNRRVDKLPAPPGLSSKVKKSTEVTDVRVGNFSSTWLPLPYPTSSVTGLTGQWYWEPGALSVSTTDSTVGGQQYEAKSILVKPTATQLARAGMALPEGFGRYLDLPPDMPPLITDTAQKVAGTEKTNYAKALALQDFFRLGDFEYSEIAPVSDNYDGTGISVITKFLQEESGYCIHFASAMAVMARSLGIPARVAVGFLPGVDSKERRGSDADQFTVTSHDLHAWPELYFDGIGWVRFEPTPGRGVVPNYAQSDLSLDPGVSDVPVDPTLPSGAAGPTRPDRLDDQNGARDTGNFSTSGFGAWAGWLWSGLAVVAALVLLLVPAILRRRRRMSRLANLRAARAPASVAWQELLDTAEDVGLRPRATSTPRETAEMLLDHIALIAPQAEAAEPLDRIVTAVEREFYAKPGGENPAGAAQAGDVVQVNSALAATVSGREAFLARFAPPSAWRALLRAISRGD
jgi:transglutaminase-like putative cysteine protease